MLIPADRLDFEQLLQDSYFLSAEECIMAAEFQNRYPNKCRWSSDGEFGSKFVTVIVTGDKDNQIHFEGYQVRHHRSFWIATFYS